MTIQVVNSLSWTVYNGSPNNLIAQYAVDFGVADTWSFQPNGNVKQSVNQAENNATASGVVIDNTQSKYAVSVSVGVTFVENIPPYSKGIVILGGTSPYVKIQGQGGCLATFYYGVFPGSFVGQNVVASTMAAIGAYLPSGLIQEWGGLVGTIPSGWLYCDGSAVSRVTYAALYNAIGTLYGAGDGSSTFNLPDRRGRFVRGFDDGAGRDPGRQLGSSQSYQTGRHAHPLPIYMNRYNATLGMVFAYDAGNNRPIFGQQNLPGSILLDYNQWTGETTATTGLALSSGDVVAPGDGTSVTETRPVNITGVFMIKS